MLLAAPYSTSGSWRAASSALAAVMDVTCYFLLLLTMYHPSSGTLQRCHLYLWHRLPALRLRKA